MILLVSFTPKKLNNSINNNEFLYRGIIEINWDFQNNRPSSATFKDSKGVSVDREADRTEKECIDFLKSSKDFFSICKVKAESVRNRNGIIKYLPIEKNIYHSEIHDSEERVQMRGSKPKKIRDESIVVYNK
ncbi:hypothetical protein H9W90_10500 [Polaribacter pectinis]|uniref:Uncharacterized protein n=1 Tax=Polaribacter pectinis TaxID=2738844 RepID=A0A7G9L7M7_9FLAO|nr:hypothetical protein [Polaribacter pectinis]QNM84626.1 hypothetical protein H9W90_10500 [Polaribacter pectinis]